MVSIVRARPNHYETLGLTPAASEEDIRRAFSTRMFSPNRMADAAQIGIAYEVLRNPAKRRAYDESIGIGAKPPAQAYPSAVSFRISARVAGPGHEPLVEETPPPRPVPAVERPVGSFIAQALREPEPREMPAAPVAVEPVVEPAPAEPAVPPEIGELLSRELPEAQRPGWNRTALAMGGMVAAAVAIGAWAGVISGGEEPDAAEAAVSVALPTAKPRAVVEAALPAAVDAPAERTARPVIVRMPVEAAPREAVAAEDRLADVSQALANVEAPAAAAVEQASVSLPEAATVQAATLPLSNRVVARTIERIGYACGQVVSTSPVDGAGSGVFKIACSSGQAYQAKPVNGRYHFRRWGRN